MRVITWGSGKHRLDLCPDHSSQYESGELPQRYDRNGQPIAQVVHGEHFSMRGCDVCREQRDGKLAG